jgi:hypothetical protein
LRAGVVRVCRLAGAGQLGPPGPGGIGEPAMLAYLKKHSAGDLPASLAGLRLLTAGEAARIVRVTRMTIYRAARCGRLDAVTIPHGYRFTSLALTRTCPALAGADPHALAGADLLTPAEIVRILNVWVDTIYRLIRLGDLPATTLSRTRHVRESALTITCPPLAGPDLKATLHSRTYPVPPGPAPAVTRTGRA